MLKATISKHGEAELVACCSNCWEPVEANASKHVEATGHIVIEIPMPRGIIL